MACGNFGICFKFPLCVWDLYCGVWGLWKFQSSFACGSCDVVCLCFGWCRMKSWLLGWWWPLNWDWWCLMEQTKLKIAKIVSFSFRFALPRSISKQTKNQISFWVLNNFFFVTTHPLVVRRHGIEQIESFSKLCHCANLMPVAWEPMAPRALLDSIGSYRAKTGLRVRNF